MNGPEVDQALELKALQAENARLIALLETYGIEWRLPQPVAVAAQEPEPSRLSTAEKVALFRQPGHKNFRQCGDQLLRNFLKGLTLRVRGA